MRRRELYEKRHAAHLAALVEGGEITLDADGLPVMTGFGLCLACGEPLGEPQSLGGFEHKLCRDITTPRRLPDVDTPPGSPTPHPAGRVKSGPRPVDPLGVTPAQARRILAGARRFVRAWWGPGRRRPRWLLTGSRAA